MSFFDDASNLIDRGVSAAKGAVSNVALEQVGFVRAFTRLCREGWELGYHERNGGNASYRLKASDIATAQSFFYAEPLMWVPLDCKTPSMAGQYLLVTAAGCYLKNVADAPSVNAGIVELNDEGSAWRVVWGFKDGGKPTSEMRAHVAAHGARFDAVGDKDHMLYHAHPVSVAALTAIEPSDSGTLTRILWGSLTESVIAFPEGVGALSWMVPGSFDLARSTADMLKKYPACIWQLHGVFASGEDADAALGLVHSIDKAAEAYLKAKAALGGKDVPFHLDAASILATASAYNLPINESLL